MLPNDPRSPDELERSRRSASLRDIRAFEEHRSGIDNGAVEGGKVGRREDPRYACLIEVHLAAPPLHRKHLEVGADAELVVEKPRQLANRHAVTHRDRIEADKRFITALEH